MRVYSNIHPKLIYNPSIVSNPTNSQSPINDAYAPYQRQLINQQYPMMNSSNQKFYERQEMQQITNLNRQRMERQSFNSTLQTKKVHFGLAEPKQLKATLINRDRPQTSQQFTKKPYQPQQNSTGKDYSYQERQYTQPEHQQSMSKESLNIYTDKYRDYDNIPSNKKKFAPEAQMYRKPMDQLNIHHKPDQKLKETKSSYQQRQQSQPEQTLIQFSRPMFQQQRDLRSDSFTQNHSSTGFQEMNSQTDQKYLREQIRERTQSKQEFQPQQYYGDKIKIQNTYQAPLIADSQKTFGKSHNNFYNHEEPKINSLFLTHDNLTQPYKLSVDYKQAKPNSILGEQSAGSYRDERVQIMSQFMDQKDIDNIRQRYQQLRA